MHSILIQIIIILKETNAPAHIHTKGNTTLGQRNGNDEVENSETKATIPQKNHAQG
jgi:hypothetical protein